MWSFHACVSRNCLRISGDVAAKNCCCLDGAVSLVLVFVFAALLPESLAPPSFLLISGWTGSFPEDDVLCFVFFLTKELCAMKNFLTLEAIFSPTSLAVMKKTERA